MRSWPPLAESTENETGNGSDALAKRPQLRAALDHARKQKATLVIAKLDRLSRNVALISALMDGKVDFVAADNLHATRLTLHILAAVAEHEARMISDRTKAALAAAKARGAILGAQGRVLAAQNKADAMVRLEPVAAVLRALKAKGLFRSRDCRRPERTGSHVARWRSLAPGQRPSCIGAPEGDANRLGTARIPDPRGGATNPSWPIHASGKPRPITADTPKPGWTLRVRLGRALIGRCDPRRGAWLTSVRLRAVIITRRAARRRVSGVISRAGSKAVWFAVHSPLMSLRINSCIISGSSART